LLSGLQEGRFPYYEEDLSAIDKQAAMDLASERRLFYVAITRAKQKLVLLETPTSDEHKTDETRGYSARSAKELVLVEICV